MKRVLVIAAVVAAAVAVPAGAANANHLCVSGAVDRCAPHLVITTYEPERTCVSSGGSDIICVF